MIDDTDQQLYLPSIESEGQADYATLEDDDEDDCSSTSSLCFSCFSRQNENMPEKLTTTNKAEEVPEIKLFEEEAALSEEEE